MPWEQKYLYRESGEMDQSKPAPKAGAQFVNTNAVAIGLGEALAVSYRPPIAPRVRSTVFAVIRNQEGKYLGVLNNTPARDWCLPQGQIEPTDADEVQAALRELREELGTMPEDFEECYPSLFGGRLLGCRDPLFDESDYLGHLMVLKEGVTVSESTYTEPMQPYLETRWGSREEICDLLVGQPDLAHNIEPDLAARLREKGRKIFCPALCDAEELMSMWDLIAPLDGPAAT